MDETTCYHCGEPIPMIEAPSRMVKGAVYLETPSMIGGLVYPLPPSKLQHEPHRFCGKACLNRWKEAQIALFASR
jgi:hypothetical protein